MMESPNKQNPTTAAKKNNVDVAEAEQKGILLYLIDILNTSFWNLISRYSSDLLPQWLTPKPHRSTGAFQISKQRLRRQTLACGPCQPDAGASTGCDRQRQLYRHSRVRLIQVVKWLKVLKPLINRKTSINFPPLDPEEGEQSPLRGQLPALPRTPPLPYGTQPGLCSPGRGPFTASSTGSPQPERTRGARRQRSLPSPASRPNPGSVWHAVPQAAAPGTRRAASDRHPRPQLTDSCPPAPSTPHRRILLNGAAVQNSRPPQRPRRLRPPPALRRLGDNRRLRSPRRDGSAALGGGSRAEPRPFLRLLPRWHSGRSPRARPSHRRDDPQIDLRNCIINRYWRRC